MQWDTSNEPSHTGQRVSYTMRNTSGYVKFGFYGQSNVGNEGVEFHIDNFKIYDTTWTSIEDGLSIEENFKIYPNPNRGVFNVQNNGSAKSTSLKLIDVQGRLVYDNVQRFSNNETFEINAENLKSGIYILLIQSEGKLEQHRIVIQ